MKLIIAKSTVLAVNANAAEITAIVLGENVMPPADTTFVIDTMANYSACEVNDDVVVEVNDELFLKYAAMYMRIAKAIAPFVGPVMSLLKSVKADLNEITDFMSQTK